MKRKNDNITEEIKFIERQERIYYSSFFLYFKWYRKLFGGKWRLIKLGRDTPYIGMFYIWTKIPNTYLSGSFKVLIREEYPITNVDTKWKLFKEFFKQLLKIGK